MSEHLTPVPKIPRTIWVLTAAAFIIALGYGFIAPILPQFTASFGVSMVAAGAVVSVFAAARLIGAPGAGILVDKVGSRPVYITGLLIVAVATFLVAFAQAYWHVFALRFIAGFGSTMFTLSAQALIVRVAPPMIRGRASAVYASAFLLGNIIGPVIGALLASLGFRIPFAVYGIGVGAAAITTRGFSEADARELANLVADVLDNPNDEANLARVAQAAQTLCAKNPVYGA